MNINTLVPHLTFSADSKYICNNSPNMIIPLNNEVKIKTNIQRGKHFLKLNFAFMYPSTKGYQRTNCQLPTANCQLLTANCPLQLSSLVKLSGNLMRDFVGFIFYLITS